MDFSFSTAQISPHSWKLNLKGYFDEFAKLPSADDFQNLKELHVDFNEVRFMNSGGIKLWINFMDSLSHITHLKVFFIKCPKIIIDQINIIEGFLPKSGKILSIYVPVFCTLCEKGFEVPLEVAKLDQVYDDLVNQVVDAERCSKYPTCIKHFELDIVKHHYFAFLKED